MDRPPKSRAQSGALTAFLIIGIVVWAFGAMSILYLDQMPGTAPHLRLRVVYPMGWLLYLGLGIAMIAWLCWHVITRRKDARKGKDTP